MGDPIIERAKGAAEGWHRSVAEHVTSELESSWAGDVFFEALHAIQRRDEAQVPGRHAILAALGTLEHDLALVLGFSRGGLARFRAALLALSDGDTAAALALYASPDPSFDERRRVTKDTTLFDVPAATQQAQDLAAIRAGLELVSPAALRRAIPALLAVMHPRGG